MHFSTTKAIQTFAVSYYFSYYSSLICSRQKKFSKHLLPLYRQAELTQQQKKLLKLWIKAE